MKNKNKPELGLKSYRDPPAHRVKPIYSGGRVVIIMDIGNREIDRLIHSLTTMDSDQLPQ